MHKASTKIDMLDDSYEQIEKYVRSLGLLSVLNHVITYILRKQEHGDNYNIQVWAKSQRIPANLLRLQYQDQF